MAEGDLEKAVGQALAQVMRLKINLSLVDLGMIKACKKIGLAVGHAAKQRREEAYI